jgi:hypothetical protein
MDRYAVIGNPVSRPRSTRFASDMGESLSMKLLAAPGEFAAVAKRFSRRAA